MLETSSLRISRSSEASSVADFQELHDGQQSVAVLDGVEEGDSESLSPQRTYKDFVDCPTRCEGSTEECWRDGIRNGRRRSQPARGPQAESPAHFARIALSRFLPASRCHGLVSRHRRLHFNTGAMTKGRREREGQLKRAWWGYSEREKMQNSSSAREAKATKD